MGSFQRVVDFLKEYCRLTETSHFLDIGAGLGKPNLHVAIDPGVEMSFGIELEQLRYQLSLYNLANCLQEVNHLKQHANVFFAHHDATALQSLNPFTHVYMFDVGFPPAVLVSIANAFNKSNTAQVLVCFTKPRKIIEQYGFAVKLISQIKTSMCGSSETHTAYVYSATPSIPTTFIIPSSTAITIPSSSSSSSISSLPLSPPLSLSVSSVGGTHTDIKVAPQTPIRDKKRKQQQPQINSVFKQAKKGSKEGTKKSLPRVLKFSDPPPSFAAATTASSDTTTSAISTTSAVKTVDSDVVVKERKVKKQTPVDTLISDGYAKLSIPLSVPTSHDGSLPFTRPRSSVSEYVSWLRGLLTTSGGLLQDTGRSKRSSSKVNYIH